MATVHESNGLDRGVNGRFAPGNAGGPGRPRRPVEETYLLAITTACPIETWERICAKAVEDALGGDPKAREWLARYLVREPEGGTPTLLHAHLHAMADLDPVLVAHAERETPDELDNLLESGRAREVLALARRLADEKSVDCP